MVKVPSLAILKADLSLASSPILSVFVNSAKETPLLLSILIPVDSIFTADANDELASFK